MIFPDLPDTGSAMHLDDALRESAWSPTRRDRTSVRPRSPAGEDCRPLRYRGGTSSKRGRCSVRSATRADTTANRPCNIERRENARRPARAGIDDTEMRIAGLADQSGGPTQSLIERNREERRDRGVPRRSLVDDGKRSHEIEIRYQPPQLNGFVVFEPVVEHEHGVDAVFGHQRRHCAKGGLGRAVNDPCSHHVGDRQRFGRRVRGPLLQCAHVVILDPFDGGHGSSGEPRRCREDFGAKGHGDSFRPRAHLRIGGNPCGSCGVDRGMSPHVGAAIAAAPLQSSRQARARPALWPSPRPRAPAARDMRQPRRDAAGYRTRDDPEPACPAHNHIAPSPRLPCDLADRTLVCDFNDQLSVETGRSARRPERAVSSVSPARPPRSAGRRRDCQGTLVAVKCGQPATRLEDFKASTRAPSAPGEASVAHRTVPYITPPPFLQVASLDGPPQGGFRNRRTPETGMRKNPAARGRRKRRRTESPLCGLRGRRIRRARRLGHSVEIVAEQSRMQVGACMISGGGVGGSRTRGRRFCARGSCFDRRPAFALPSSSAACCSCHAVLAGWRRSDLLDGLVVEREHMGLRRCARVGSRRRRWPTDVRSAARSAAPGARRLPRIAANADELAALAESARLAAVIDPICVAACSRLFTDGVTSPLFNFGLPAQDARSRLARSAPASTGETRSGALSGAGLPGPASSVLTLDRGTQMIGSRRPVAGGLVCVRFRADKRIPRRCELDRDARRQPRRLPRQAIVFRCLQHVRRALVGTAVATRSRNHNGVRCGGCRRDRLGCARGGALEPSHWWLGLPSSSAHALVGGLVGSALVEGGSVRFDGAA